MSKRKTRILEFLSRGSIVTSGMLAQYLDVSSRTIQKDIKELNEEAQGMFIIHAKPRIGYTLEELQEQGVSIYIETLETGLPEIPTTSEDRVAYLLDLFLLDTSAYVKVDDLANHLYVSKSSISADLKVVREELERHNLKLMTRPNYGMRVEGSEFDLRLCTASFTLRRIENAEKRGMTETLRIIDECVNKHLLISGVRISDVTYRNLVIHIYIAIQRIKENHFVPMDTSMLKKLKENSTSMVAQNIANELGNLFAIQLPDTEVGYLTLHLSGKRFIEVNSGEENVVVSQEINEIVTHMLGEIKSGFNIDFMNDFELIMNLSLHLVPMDVRIRYDMNLRNPLIADIKNRYSLAYLLAMTSTGVLKKYYGKDVDEEEVGYIALHFNLALERKKSVVNKKNIAIVCATGRGSASLLVHKFRSKVGTYIDQIKTLDVMHVRDYDFSDTDYIISTVPIPFKVPIPILEVQYFMNEKDIRALKQLLNSDSSFRLEKYFDERLFIPRLKAKTKEEALKKMVATIQNIKVIPENFYDLVMKREQMAITAFGNRVAIPHPCEPSGSETFVCIAILDKVISWDGMEVQFIFMMSLMDGSDENMDVFSNAVSKFLISDGYVDAVIEARTFQSLVDCFNDIDEKMENKNYE